MAFIQLESSNPDFTFLIRKNPASGMIVKPFRQGLLFGYYSLDNPSQFNCWFKDSDSQVSYDADKQFEFNDTTRYSSATFVGNCLDEFFREVLAKDQQHDAPGFENAILINCLRSRKKYFEIFARSFKDFELEYEPLSTTYFRVRIRTRQSLRKLLSYTAVLAMINAIQNREFRYIDDQLLLRYAKIIRHLDAPYFVRYVFKVNLVRGDGIFAKVRELLDTETIKMTFGHNFLQRYRFVARNIAGGTIIDIGCGEGRYFVLSKNVDHYYAHDQDETCLENSAALIRKKQYDNITLLDSLDALPNFEGRKTFLLTEVIEHNTKDDAMKLLQRCFVPGARILVTTPNRDFNVLYFPDDFEEQEKNLSTIPVENDTEDEPIERMRHEEHVFEFNDVEFRDFIQKAVEGYEAKIQFFPIGDTVDGVTPQSAAIIDLKSDSLTFGENTTDTSEVNP